MASQDVRTTFRAALTEALGPGDDLGTMEDALPALTATLWDFAAPDFTCVMAAIPPTPRQSYPGVEGIARAWADYGEAFESISARLEDIRESDRHIVLLVQQTGVTRHQAVEITQPSAMVFAFDDEDRVARIEFHLDRSEALRVAGLAD